MIWSKKWDGVVASCASKDECDESDTVSVCSDEDFGNKLGVACYVGQYNLAKHIACIPGQVCKVSFSCLIFEIYKTSYFL